MADWKNIVKQIAPTLGTLLGGPMAGTAVTALSKIFFSGDESKSEAEVSQAVLSELTPDKIAILIMFALTMFASLYGAYQLLIGGLKLADASIVAAVSGFIGSIVGYVAANAQQVVSYFYGSSAGSKQKTDALADSVKNIVK